MAIKVECECGKQLRVNDELAGRKVRCPTCQGVVSVPGEAEEEEGYGTEKVRKCPGCKREWPLDTVVCIDCGYNFESGRKMKTKYNIPDRWIDLGAPFLGTFTRYRVFRNDKGKPALMVSRRFLFIPLGSRTYDLSGFRAVLTDCVVGDGEESADVYYLEIEGPKWGRVKLLRTTSESKWRDVLELVSQAGRLEIKRK